MALSWTTPGTEARPTYAGAVLGTTGRDVRIMSDVWAWMTYAEVWTGSEVTEVAIASSEFGGYATATVDATPEVLAAVGAWRAVKAAEAARAAVEASIGRMVSEAGRVTKGKDVTVVRGRKVAKGTTGVVFWVGDSRFGTRVGIDTGSDRVFTALSNVEVSDPDTYVDFDTVTAMRAAVA